MTRDGDSRKVWSTDSSHTRPWEEKRTFQDEPGGPPKPRTPRPARAFRPEPPTIPPVGEMEVIELLHGDLEKTSDPFLFSCELDSDGKFWDYLTKNMGHVTGRGEGVKVDIFWLEPEREQNFDLLWKKYRHAIKLVVKEGPCKGWVGYYRVIA